MARRGAYAAMVQQQQLAKDDGLAERPEAAKGVNAGPDKGLGDEQVMVVQEGESDLEQADEESGEEGERAHLLYAGDTALPRKRPCRSPAVSTLRVVQLLRPDWRLVTTAAVVQSINGATLPLASLVFAQMLQVLFEPDAGECTRTHYVRT